MKKMLVRIVTAALMICSLVCANICTPFTKVNAQELPGEFKLHVIECPEDGLAALIEVNKKYVLVDGGKGDTTVANYLARNCEKEDEKVVLEAIVLTHNHNDHITGILNILNDTNRFKVKKIFMEDIYNPGSEFKSDLNAAIQKQRKVYGKNALEAVHMVEKNGKGYKAAEECENIELDKVNIKIYPPMDDFVGGKKLDNTTHSRGYRMNEASLVVKVNGNSRSALIMGDALDYGFASLALSDKYAEEFKSDFCILAHHGLRSYQPQKKKEYATFNKNGEKITCNINELALYNRHITASHYVFASSKKQFTSAAKYNKYRKQYAKLKNANKEKPKFYYTFNQGTVHYNSATGNVKTNR